MTKKLVAYFSASGTTARVAHALAEAAGADLFEISPAQPYTVADLNWQDRGSRSSMEMNDEAAGRARFPTVSTGCGRRYSLPTCSCSPRRCTTTA